MTNIYDGCDNNLYGQEPCRYPYALPRYHESHRMELTSYIQDIYHMGILVGNRRKGNSSTDDGALKSN